MALNNEMKKLETTIKEVIEIQTKLDTIPNVVDFSLDANEERRVFEQMIGYYRKVSSYIAKLNTRLNMVVTAVNKLPVEVLAYIIFLTNSELTKTKDKHPYILYTWVCHHWRSVLIHTPYLWTSIQLGASGDGDKGLPITPFMRELIDRSKSAPLDIKLSHRSTENLPMLVDFFAQEQDRINTLSLSGNRADLIPLVLAGKRFPFLRGIVYDTNLPFNDKLHVLIPCITASDHLVTLDCNFWHTFPIKMIEQLIPTFKRIQKLRLGVYAPGIIQTILNSLRNNTKLRALRILVLEVPKSFEQTTWPELELLSVFPEMFLKNVHAPKLSNLDMQCGFPITFNSGLIFDKFNYSAIKYLNILDLKRQDFHYVLGLNETIHIRSEFSITSKDLLDEIRAVNDALTEDLLTDTWTRGYLRAGFHCEEVFIETLEGALSTIFPRMTGLQELCLMSRLLINNEEIGFEKILTRLPSIERLMVPAHGGEVLDFIRLLGNGSLCPQLKHLSYMVSYFHCFSLNELEKFAENVGKLLVECLKSRQKVLCANVLEYIILGNCPPLPDTCVEECRNLGTTVVTEVDFDCLVGGETHECSNEMPSSSDSE